MAELLTIDELEQRLRTEVAAAGGAKKWCRRTGVHMNHALHMVENGSAATLPHVADALGFRKAIRYERVKEPR